MQFEMMEPRLCQIVCKIAPTQDEAKDLKEKIEDEYRINMWEGICFFS
jgi:transmembrane 9 superfamily member 2/4